MSICPADVPDRPFPAQRADAVGATSACQLSLTGHSQDISKSQNRADVLSDCSGQAQMAAWTLARVPARRGGGVSRGSGGLALAFLFQVEMGSCLPGTACLGPCPPGLCFPPIPLWGSPCQAAQKLRRKPWRQECLLQDLTGEMKEGMHCVTHMHAAWGPAGQGPGCLSPLVMVLAVQGWRQSPGLHLPSAQLLPPGSARSWSPPFAWA